LEHFGGRALRSKDQGRQNAAGFCEGMSEAIDLAKPEPKPPAGGVPGAVGARKQSCAGLIFISR
jgi:hypothetical protein